MSGKVGNKNLKKSLKFGELDYSCKINLHWVGWWNLLIYFCWVNQHRANQLFLSQSIEQTNFSHNFCTSKVLKTLIFCSHYNQSSTSSFIHSFLQWKSYEKQHTTSQQETCSTFKSDVSYSHTHKYNRGTVYKMSKSWSAVLNYTQKIWTSEIWPH